MSNNLAVGNSTSEFRLNHHTFPFRVGREQQGSKEFFQIHEWKCQQDESIEQIKYFSPRPERKIKEIEYEGWRRYIEERREEEGIRIILHVRDLKVQAALARAIEHDEFKEIGWLEPIRVILTDNPIVAINFREKAIENNANYINHLFQRIGQIEPLPDEILYDLKYFIANNCVNRFIKKFALSKNLNFSDIVKILIASALSGVSSPFYTAALYCQKEGKFTKARELLKRISREHWQFYDAINLKDDLYEKELSTLKTENLKLRALNLQQPTSQQSTSNCLSNSQGNDFKGTIHKLRDYNNTQNNPPDVLLSTKTPVTFLLLQQQRDQILFNSKNKAPKTPKDTEKPMIIKLTQDS